MKEIRDMILVLTNERNLFVLRIVEETPDIIQKEIMFSLRKIYGLAVNQSETSLRLTRLKKLNLITEEKKGINRYYRVNKETLDKVYSLLNKLKETCQK